MPTRLPTFNALIRTHHITSRKKIARLRQAAAAHDVFALLRSGGSPGIMYVEGLQPGVEEWVAVVQVRPVSSFNVFRSLLELTLRQKLRYKDYHLASRPAALVLADRRDGESWSATGLYEVDSVKDFAERMRQQRVFDWWREAMGYTTGQSDRL